ncbi:MAG: winged helix-turn-helix transcriptional regulator [Dehalococcoidales bacterium]|nr:winged helix-turn-helix transcriptional regulator [Dehalococcoidales bacterium]
MSESIFKALADANRREILRLLGKGTMTAGEVATYLPIAKSTLSSHFNILKKADLIREEKEGTTVYYSLNLSVVEEVTAAVMGLFNIDRPDAAKGENDEV